MKKKNQIDVPQTAEGEMKEPVIIEMGKEEMPFIAQLPIESVRSCYPATHYESGKRFKKLMRTVQENGVITPVFVCRADDGKYDIVRGRRRLAAARKAGFTEIPAVICGNGPEGLHILKLERKGTEEPDYFEEADNYRRVLMVEGCSQKKLAEEVGRSQAYVSNKLRLLLLSPTVRRMITEKELSERHAREIVRLYDEKLQKAALCEMARKKMTAGEAAKYVTMILGQYSKDLQRRFKKTTDDYSLRTKGLRVSESRNVDNAEILRHLIGAVKELVDISRDSGLKLQAGQRNRDGHIEIVIRVPTKGNEVALRKTEDVSLRKESELAA